MTMAAIGYAITSKLIEVLASETIVYICKLWNYKSKLEQLRKTVFRIQKVFLDADACWEQLNEQQREFIKELKDVVYDAADVFDEFHTRTELNQRAKKRKVRKFFGQVRGLFSFDKNQNHVIYANKVACDVKDIMKRLDDIAGDHNKFNLQLDNKHILRRPIETCSYVDAHKIIGRDKDKDEIINVLLDPTFETKFCFLSIVGMGGLGKTALAQLVFNDEKIQAKFQDSTYRLWVCVSDQDRVKFDEKIILCKILELITGKKECNDSSKELVVQQFQQKIRGKKYVLVLDDVWNEDRNTWSKLEEFLRMGLEGSKIIITTRSERTASIIDKKHVHMLEGLSQEDSQCLFEMAAFGEAEKNEEFLEIGEKIMEKCHRNPLAIKIVGSFLFRKDITDWQSIERCGLADIEDTYKNDNSDKILPILKLSYYNLAPSLKSCFSYCAIFPKDYKMKKRMLIDHWIAQAYIVPLGRGQNFEEAIEEHFNILIRRCFFQDIETDRYGNIWSVKIHDLLHDVAQEVGKEEICVASSNVSELGENIRHVNIINDKSVNIYSRRKIRTYICSYSEGYEWDRQIENLRALRVLHLSFLDLKSLPKTINRLLLLRYLNLERNTRLEVLPNSITELYNLQTLILRHCENLREVPSDFRTLINLRHLDFYYCFKIKEMPLGILKLENLKVLSYYVASNEISNEELYVLQQVFTNLKGEITIQSVDDTKSGDSKNIKSLTRININKFTSFAGTWVINEDVLERLELPTYLNELNVLRYKGKTIPQVFSVHKHVVRRIDISNCSNLEQIIALSKLPHLKSLILNSLNSVEYVENEMSSNINNTKAVEEIFPSLEFLEIENMKKLKGWWKGDFSKMRFRFPQLSHLKFYDCPNLTSFVPSSNQFPKLCTLYIICCPNLVTNINCPPTLEKLELTKISESLIITGELGKLREMKIEKVDYLKLLSPTDNSQTELELSGKIDVDSAVECLESCASSLQTLTFWGCENMKRLPRMDHLISLEKLELIWNDELSICEEDDEEESWKYFPRSLRHLVFNGVPKMKSLPKGMQHLTSLQSLEIDWCENMEGGLPEWISSLSSLQSLKIGNCEGIKSFPEAMKDLTSLKELYIYECPDLKERCKNPDGEDFPKIQHIRSIEFYTWYDSD